MPQMTGKIGRKIYSWRDIHCMQYVYYQEIFAGKIYGDYIRSGIEFTKIKCIVVRLKYCTIFFLKSISVEMIRYEMF